MFSTLQAAFGTWPSDKSFNVDNEVLQPKPSGLNEGFSFGDATKETPHKSAASLFVLRAETYPSDGTFVPPFFTPPESSSHEFRRLDATPGLIRQPTSLTPSNTDGRSAEGNILTSESVPNDDTSAAEEMDIDLSSRSPSPEPSKDDFESERGSLWSDEARTAFHEMVTASGYVNRYRMHMKKKQRMIHFLEHPDLIPTLCDGSTDHQTKYQSANWTLMDGKLYRKPEFGRVGTLRRHLDETEAWEVLTREHLRSGHLGRDKLRKRLEQRYIGYTLQEIMLVLRECKRCSGKETASVIVAEVSVEPAISSLSNTSAVTAAHDHGSMGQRNPFGRRQTSNMMWP